GPRAPAVAEDGDGVEATSCTPRSRVVVWLYMAKPQWIATRRAIEKPSARILLMFYSSLAASKAQPGNFPPQDSPFSSCFVTPRTTLKMIFFLLRHDVAC